MKLWQNVFETEIDKLADNFNRSIGFDKILYEYDIKGTIAHVSMLVKQNIIGQEDGRQIAAALEELLDGIKDGKVAIDESYEDIHSFVELYLTQKIGSVAKKMHTGRSRNDQVALDMKLYVIDKSRQISFLISELVQKLIAKAEENISVIMPMFTHLRKAQPSTYGHYLCAYIEMFLRDLNRISTVHENCMQSMPLGSGACCGNTYDIDRGFVANKLGFTDITYNSIDGVSDRDYILDMLYALSMIVMHMSRYCEELIIFTSEQYGFMKISDAFCSGSSMMPQKKNPDMAELIRGKTGRVYGALTQMLTTMKAQPLSYNKDMQEDKECFFNAIDTTIKCTQIFTAMAASITLNEEVMYNAAKDSYITAVDAADYLSKKGLPFRDAYAAAAKLVNYCIDKGIYFYDLTLQEMQQIHPDFDEGLLRAISVENSIALRKQIGSPAPDMVRFSLEKYKERLMKFL